MLNEFSFLEKEYVPTVKTSNNRLNEKCHTTLHRYTSRACWTFNSPRMNLITSSKPTSLFHRLFELGKITTGGLSTFSFTTTFATDHWFDTFHPFIGCEALFHRFLQIKREYRSVKIEFRITLSVRTSAEVTNRRHGAKSVYLLNVSIDTEKHHGQIFLQTANFLQRSIDGLWANTNGWVQGHICNRIAYLGMVPASNDEHKPWYCYRHPAASPWRIPN